MTYRLNVFLAGTELIHYYSDDIATLEFHRDNTVSLVRRTFKKKPDLADPTDKIVCTILHVENGHQIEETEHDLDIK